MKNELKPYIHVAQYYETDQMKIIHHSNYIRWFEEARVDFLDQIGANYAKLEASRHRQPSPFRRSAIQNDGPLWRLRLCPDRNRFVQWNEIRPNLPCHRCRNWRVAHDRQKQALLPERRKPACFVEKSPTACACQLRKLSGSYFQRLS